MLPRVTAIIPTYNRDRFLAEAVASVLQQTLAELELIVVDDGSTDDTTRVLANFADPRMRLLRQEHRGIGAAMNSGIRAARSDYIARLDSDDRWCADFLEMAVTFLDAHEEIGAIYGKGQAMNVSGCLLPATLGMAPRFPNDHLRSMLYDDFTCNIATVVRRVCFDRAGPFDEALPAHEDWDMWLRVAQHFRFAFVDRVVAHYRRHDGNLTASQSPMLATLLAARARPLDKFFRQPRLPAALLAMKASAYENVYLSTGLRLLDAGSPIAASRSFGRAMGVAANPVRAAARVLWFSLVVRYFSRAASGQRLVMGATNLRRRWLGA